MRAIIRMISQFNLHAYKRNKKEKSATRNFFHTTKTTVLKISIINENGVIKPLFSVIFPLGICPCS